MSTKTDDEIITAYTGLTHEQRVERERERKRRAAQQRPKPSPKLDDRTMQVREIVTAVNESMAVLEAAVRTFQSSLTYPPMPGPDLQSRLGAQLDAGYATTLATLDELYETVRPKVEHARELAAQLTADLAAEERAAREAAEAERRRQEFENAVQAEVEEAEAARLRKIEDAARKRLESAGAR